MNLTNTRRALTIICTAAIVFAGIALAACGNPQAATDGTPTAAPDATIAASPLPEMTPPSQLSGPGHLAEATIVAITPIASGTLLRTDCPTDTATYRDTARTMSLCAPGWLAAVAGVDNVGAPGITLQTPVGSTEPRLTVTIEISPRAAIIGGSSVQAQCDEGFVPDQTSAEVVARTVAGLPVVACHVAGESNDPAGPLEEITGTARVPGSSPALYLNVLVTWRTQSAGAASLIESILATAELGS